MVENERWHWAICYGHAGYDGYDEEGGVVFFCCFSWFPGVFESQDSVQKIPAGLLPILGKFHAKRMDFDSFHDNFSIFVPFRRWCEVGTRGEYKDKRPAPIKKTRKIERNKLVVGVSERQER
jgi:hypothetical protein